LKKVVDTPGPLRSVEGGAAKKPARPLPRVLDSLKKHCVDMLARFLAEMLDGADDKLFDMSEKASDAERDRYFDAMRELRVKRAGIEAGFSRNMIDSFHELAEEPADGSDAPKKEIDFDSLALVNEDELEMNVTIDNMARRIRNACDAGLRLLSHRIEYVLESRMELGEKSNPMEPRQIIQSFADGMTHIDLDIRTRLVILKLFERMLQMQISSIVAEANQSLIDAGILPDLKGPPAPQRRAAGSGRSVAGSGAGAGSAVSHESGIPGSAEGGEAGVQLFGMLQELLSGGVPTGMAYAPQGGVPAGGMMPPAGHQGAVMGGAAGMSGDSPVVPGNMAVMQNGVPYMNGMPLGQDVAINQLSSAELLDVLTRLQRIEQSIEDRLQASGPAKLDELDVRTGLSELLQTEDGEAVHALDRADDDVINLVSMLFDFILDDNALRPEVKALIGRLQIPLLKVAIADKSFFSRDDHPARELLNALAQTGAQWSPAQGTDDDVYQNIEKTVHRILDDFEDDPALFSELLLKLQSFNASQTEQIGRLEARVRQVEEGRARADAARVAVARLLEQRLNGRQLPEVGVEAARDAWQQVLYLTHLREGEDSSNWEQRVKLLDALVWSVLPHQKPESLARLEKVSSRVLTHFRSGLEDVGYDPVEINRLVSGLREVHEAKLKGGESRPRVAVEIEVPEEAEPVPLFAVVRTELPEDALADTQATAGFGDESVDLEQESGSQCPPEASAPEVITALSLDHPLVHTMNELKPGQWVEFVNPAEHQEDQRLRLAANIRSGAKLVFINKRGIKICEYPAAYLAALVEKGLARIIEDARLFDRALESVIGGLRQRQQGSTPPGSR